MIALSKAVKLKNDNYLGSTSIVHKKKKLSTILDKIEIAEVIENENGTAIKYANGIMKCFGNILLSNVNLNTPYGNLYIEATNRRLDFPVPFKDTKYSITLNAKSFGGGIGGTCGRSSAVDYHNYWIWHANKYEFSNGAIEISYEATGKWK